MIDRREGTTLETEWSFIFGRFDLDIRRDTILGDGPVFAALVLTAIAAQMSVAVSQILLGLALLIALVRIALRRDRPARTGLELPTLLFFGWALLTILFSTDPADSLRHAKRFYLFTALWLCAGAVRGERRRSVMMAAALFGAAFNSVHTLVTQAWPLDGPIPRLPMMQNSVITGSWLVMAAALLALAHVLHGGRLRGRILSGLAALPMLLALLLTQARGAWLGFAAGAVTVAALKRKRLLLVVAVAGVAAYLVAPVTYRERLRSVVDPTFRTNVQRFRMWEAGVDLIREHPLTGVGDRDLRPFCPVMHPSAKSKREIRLSHFHSNLLMMAVIWGLPGLALGVWFLTALVLRLRRAWLRTADGDIRAGPLRRTWVAAALGVWVGLMVTGIFDWSFGDPEFTLVAFSTIGVALALDAPSDGH